jgi:hypothetical protein
VLAVLGQSLLLAWIVARPDGVPAVVRPVVFGLSVVAAMAIGLDVGASPAETAWWQPRRPAWALGAAVAGANVGVVLAYCLRRLEAAEHTEATGRWQRPAAASALVTGIGTAVVQSTVLPNPDVVGAVLVLATANALFVVLYLYRRRNLVRRARRTRAGFGDIDAPDVEPPDGDR